MRNSRWLSPLILVAILAAILLPVALTGYSELAGAESANAEQDYGRAADLYIRAAGHLPWRKDLWEQAGIAAGLGGDSSNAIDYLLQTARLSHQGWAVLGSAYFNTGDLEAALDAYQNGLDEYGPSASIYYGMSLAYRLQKDWPAERAALENYLALDVGDVHTHYRLGLLLTLLDSERAFTELMLASSLDPEFDPAVQTLRAALNLSSTQPEASAQRVTIGRALGLVNEWDLALEAFEQALELDSENAEAWAWLGEAKQQTGRDGRVQLDRALSLDHQSVIVRALRGLYWNRQGKFPQMLAEYKLAAEYEPENPAWLASIGDAYIQLGDLAAALTAYQRATELAPNESTYWRLLAVFCAGNGVRVEDIGLPAAQKAVDLAPDDIAVLDALGWSYSVSGRHYTAEQTLLDVIARDPNYLPARLHLAMNYLAQGNQVAAYTELAHIRDNDPDGANGQLAEEILKQYFP